MKDLKKDLKKAFIKDKSHKKSKNKVSQKPFETEDEANERIDVLNAMCQYGGGFVKSLSAMLLHSDAINTRIIKNAWPEYWKEYKKIALASKLKK